MTKEELFRAVGEVRVDQIADAEDMKKESRPWRRYGTLAACFAVLLAGAFALARLEGAWKWAELEKNFQTADDRESAPDAGGGEDEADWGGLVMPFNPLEPPESAADLDGAEYWTEGGKRPGFNYSVNVEIGELDRETQAAEDVFMNAGKNRTEAGSAACLAWLSPEEIFARDTVIFRGAVRELRYYEVEEVRLGGSRTQYTAAAVEVTDAIRGDLAAGETVTVLYPGGPNMTTSISGSLEELAVGSEAIFMPERTSWETGVKNSGTYFCYADLAGFYLSEGLRFVFADTGDGLDFERGVYEEIAEAETLDEVAAYIREIIGAPEQARSAAVPAEPQADPGKTDPALLDPVYGAESPNGGRELPDGTVPGPADLMIGG